MILSFSDNAVMTKARALYGKGLKTSDYNRLLELHTVGAIAAYLKTETHYAEVLSEAQEELIHRGQLEDLLHKRILNICLRLINYSYGDNLFLKVYAMQNEVSQLLSAIRLLNAGNISRYIVSLPMYMNKYMSLDLYALAHIQNFDDLLECLRHSPYYEVLRTFRPLKDQPIAIVGCETALLTLYYKTLCEHVEAQYHGDTRGDLLQIFKLQIDIHNLSTIYRLKRFFNYTPAQIKECLIPLSSRLSPRQYQSLLDAPALSDFFAILQQHSNIFRVYPIDAAMDSAEAISQVTRTKQHAARKLFRFSSRPIVVAICYLTLLEIEASNITHIIEGVRYGISADEIRSMLAI